jgi:hypothetical protein
MEYARDKFSVASGAGIAYADRSMMAGAPATITEGSVHRAVLSSVRHIDEGLRV